MNDSVVVGGCLVLALLTAGVVGLLTGSYATVFAGTPIGFAIYLAVGVGLPQYLLFRESESPAQLGLATLSVAAGILVVLGSVVLHSPTAEWGIGIALLFLIVIGSVLGAIVREFRAGYRTDT